MINRIDNDPAFLRKITFSDECVFHMSGRVNKHNIHDWAVDNPNVRLQTNTGKTSSLTVWACIGFNGVIAIDISPETMNGDRYCQIRNEHIVQIFTRNLQMLFQQDGAPPTTQQPCETGWTSTFPAAGLADVEITWSGHNDLRI